MGTLLLALFFLATGYGVFTFSRVIKKRRAYLRAFAEKFGLACNESQMELTGALEGLEVRVHNDLRGDRALEMGAPVGLSHAPMVVDVAVPGCPPGLRLQSTPPRLAAKAGAGPTVTPHETFETAFAASASEDDDLAILESDAVREAFMAIASVPSYRGALLEGGTLSVFHFNPTLGSPLEAAELGRTVGLALAAAAALGEICSAR